LLTAAISEDLDIGTTHFSFLVFPAIVLLTSLNEEAYFIASKSASDNPKFILYLEINEAAAG